MCVIANHARSENFVHSTVLEKNSFTGNGQKDRTCSHPLLCCSTTDPRPHHQIETKDAWLKRS